MVGVFEFWVEEEPDRNEAGGSHGDIVCIVKNKFAGSTVDFNCAYAQCSYGVPNTFYGVSNNGAKGFKIQKVQREMACSATIYYKRRMDCFMRRG